jgi:hypothetical protein
MLTMNANDLAPEFNRVAQMYDGRMTRLMKKKPMMRMMKPPTQMEITVLVTVSTQVRIPSHPHPKKTTKFLP